MTNLPAEVQTQIKSYLELSPGVDATRANLKTLLAFTIKWGYSKYEDDLRVSIIPGKRKKQQVLHARLDGPAVCSLPHGARCISCRLCELYRSRLRDQEFPADEDGLLEALVYLKTAVKKYREEGVCETCKTATAMRLKADGMPQCERCVLNAALGLAPA